LFLKKGIYFIGIEWLCTEQTKQNGLKVGMILNKEQKPNTFYRYPLKNWMPHLTNSDGENHNIMLKIKLLQ